MDCEGESLLAPDSLLGNIASKIKNINGKSMENEGKLKKAIRSNLATLGTFVTPIEGDTSNNASCKDDNDKNEDGDAKSSMNGDKTAQDSGDDLSGNKPSFASIFKERTTPKAVCLAEMTNSEFVVGANVAISIFAVKEVSNRFKNTLYGYFIGKRLAFPVENYVKNTEGMERVLENGPWLIRLVPIFLNIGTPNTRLAKETITTTPIWVKPHNVPVMAFSEGRNTYARALIEVSSLTALKESLVVDIPFPNGAGHALETVEVVAVTPVEDNGFTKVTRKHGKGKKKGESRQVTGIKLTKPKPNFQYHVVQKNLEPSEADKILDIDTSLKNNPINELEDDEEDIEEMVMDNPLGDFNVALYVDDKSTGSSSIDTSMHDFQDCIEAIEISDVNSTGSCAMFQSYRIFDHSPAVLRVPISSVNKPRPFKFYNFMVHNTRFKEVVANGWLNSLCYKLDEAQKALDYDPNNLDIQEEEVAYLKAYHDALIMEERFLMQKAKVEWLKLGDANTAYFHKVVKSQAARNRIDSITNSNGVCVVCDQLSRDAAIHMVCDVTDNKIQEAIFSMKDNKAMGLDGYSAAFFNEACDIIAVNVIKAIKEFFTNGVFLKELNHTIISLIPKVTTPMRIHDYRPISCCNVLFKCISKIISNRMKDCLPNLVSLNQSAFVPERRISDNILLTQELMHNYHLDRGPSRCVFKVDIQKAYDTIDWKFLHDVLVGFGFHPHMIGWIIVCVTSTSFSLSINGYLHGYFKGKRGLRQGDPMSPYLFTLVMEVLTLMLKRRARDSNYFTYHRYCSKINFINLCFADDLFLFAHGDKDSARVIMDSLEEFKNVSGLTHSLPKSTTLKSGLVIGRINRFLLRVELSLSIMSLVLPSRLMLELEQAMRGFLWCQGEMKRGKAKGNMASAWFDNWCVLHPLSNIISNRDMYGAGLRLNAKVNDIIRHGSWCWPNEWALKYPPLNNVIVPHLSDDADRLKWRNLDVVDLNSSVAKEHLKQFMGISNIPSELNPIMNFLILSAKIRSARNLIVKLIFAALCYFIWQERNDRLFMKKKRSQDQVIDVIKSNVRLKLLTCRFKKTAHVQTLFHR
nr:hypothetical protein [Tanacetum cinerariifolium]